MVKQLNFCQPISRPIMTTQNHLFKILGGIAIFLSLLSLGEISAKTDKPMAQSLAAANNLLDLAESIGEHLSVVPPTAWTCTRQESGIFTLKQKQLTSGLVVINWGDGSGSTSNNLQAYQVSTGLETFDHTYTGTGPWNITVMACADDITYIEAPSSTLTTVNVVNLTSLEYLYLRENIIRNTVDLENNLNLIKVDLDNNRMGTLSSEPSGYMELKIKKIKDLRASNAKLDGTLDFSQANELTAVVATDNFIDQIILPSGAGPFPFETISAYNNEINQSFDFKPYANLIYINLAYNKITSVDTKDLQNLENVWLNNNVIRGMVDLEDALSLNILTLQFNDNGSNGTTDPIPNGNLYLKIGNVRILNAYRAVLADTVDMSTATNMEECILAINSLSQIMLPSTGSTYPLHRIEIFNNNLAQELDLSDFNLLNKLLCQNNQLTKIIMPLNAGNLDHVIAANNNITNIDDMADEISSYGIITTPPQVRTLQFQGGTNTPLDPSKYTTLNGQGWTVTHN